MPILRTRINYLKGNSTIVEPDSANTQAAASKEDNIEQLPVHKIALILPILVILAGNFLIVILIQDTAIAWSIRQIQNAMHMYIV